MTEVGEVAERLTLPSGLVLQNRLVKAAMAEKLAKNGQVSEQLEKPYQQWGRGGWGAIMTGNVMVDERYMGSPQDAAVHLGTNAETEKWRRIARAIKAQGALAIMQINHPGRQSPVGAGSRGFLDKNIAPSAVPLNFGQSVVVKTLVKLLFGTPAEMSTTQIQTVINQFVDAAKLAQQTGFDGVTIHAAHGYLLSDFLSPKSNTRTDAYGGTPEKRAKIIVDIIRATRESLGAKFSISVKMNSSDQQYDVESDAVLRQIDVLVAQDIDFLEVSGGSYENPRMIGGDELPAKSERTQRREAFFLDFALAVRERHPTLCLMLTGGFRTRAAMNSALNSKGCDMIGIGRPAVPVPDFPRSVIGIGASKEISEAEAGLQLQKVKEPWLLKHLPFPQLQRTLAGGAETGHYSAKIGQMGSA
ncbi:FMN-linked oxidoreductase, partial [Aureobasidium melanogenum]|uniref:FMN-linked oxidoreductase n=1 Tax=Aureobasidium melanogenum (strain CBS 110374) TaxID=1043003 RepID=A0A074W087_AURM1